MSISGKFVREVAAWVDRLTSVPLAFLAEETMPNCTIGLPLLEFYLHISGSSAKLRTGDLEAVSRPGDLIVNNGHFGHYGQPERNWCCWVISFDISTTTPDPALAQRPLLRTARIPDVQRLGTAFEAVERAARHPGAMRNTRIKAAVTVLLAEIHDSIEDSPGAGTHSPAVDRALALIHRPVRHGSRLTVSRLAQLAGLSEDHFGRRFRDEIGTSPGAYLARARMDRAAALLQRSALQIKEVAAAVGFADPLSFSKAFRKHYGIGPRQWRKENRGFSPI